MLAGWRSPKPPACKLNLAMERCRLSPTSGIVDGGCGEASFGRQRNAAASEPPPYWAGCRVVVTAARVLGADCDRRLKVRFLVVFCARFGQCGSSPSTFANWIVLKLQYYTRSILKILPNFNHTTPKHNILTIFNFVVLTIILRGDIQRIKSVRSPVGWQLVAANCFRPVARGIRESAAPSRDRGARRSQYALLSKSTMHEQRPAWTPAEISAGISVAYFQRHYIKIFKVRGRRRPAGSPGSPGGSETRVRERERKCVDTVGCHPSNKNGCFKGRRGQTCS
jgi:hypothetical protein